MRTLLAFTQRSVRLFLRDKATVFFSFLSTLILVALYFLFIGKNYADGITAMVGGLLSDQAVYAVVYAQMMVGVLVLNSLSLSIGAFSLIAHDFERRRVDSFLLTPLRPAALLLAYYAGGFLVSFVLNTFTWLLSLVLIGLVSGYWVSLGCALAVTGILLFASLVSCSLMLLFTALVKSSAAIGTFSGVAGTFFGFLCGIYMPYELLGTGVQFFGSILPFTHITIWLKQIVLADAFAALRIPAAFHAPLLEGFSAHNIGILGLQLPLSVALLYTALIALACLAFARHALHARMKQVHASA